VPLAGAAILGGVLTWAAMHFGTKAMTTQQLEPHMPPAASVVASPPPTKQAEPFDWDRAVTESLARLAKKP